jgi:hypothetical protein
MLEKKLSKAVVEGDERAAPCADAAAESDIGERLPQT